MNDAIQGLTIVINYPPGVAEVMFPTFLKAFIDITLIKLCVTHQRNHSTKLYVAAPLFGTHIVLHK